MKLTKHSYFSLALICVLCACDGGGSDNEPPAAQPADVSPDGSLPAGDNLNAGLDGRIYIEESSSYLDVRSGEMVEVGGSSLSPSSDGLEYVTVDEDIDRVETDDCFYSVELDRVKIHDAASGAVSTSFDIPADIWHVRLSPDRQYVAAFYKDDNKCLETSTRLSVFARDGTPVIQSVEGIDDFDWLPDSRLVLSWKDAIYVEKEPLSLDLRRVADLSGIEGTAIWLAASPDGSSVLFEMATGTNPFNSTVSYRNATVWSVNTDGTELKQIATSARPDDPATDSDDPQVNAPTWSPDGSMLLLTEAFTSGGVVDDVPVIPTVIPIDNPGITYLVPATIDSVALPPTEFAADGITPLEVLGSNGTVVAGRLSPFGSQRWAPSP